MLPPNNRFDGKAGLVVDIVKRPAIALCPRDDQHGRLADCSQEGFGTAKDESVQSPIRSGMRAGPLISQGNTTLEVSCHRAEKMVKHCNVMDPNNTALEATTGYLSVKLDDRTIRAHALSPETLETRAASAIDHFDELIDDAPTCETLHRLTMIDTVGAVAACTVSGFARSVSGYTAYINGGHHLV